MRGIGPLDFIVQGLAEISGYLLAATSLLALAPTLKAGAHIRVTMLLSALGTRARWLFELGAILATLAFSAYMAWRLCLLMIDSAAFPRGVARLGALAARLSAGGDVRWPRHLHDRPAR